MKRNRFQHTMYMKFQCSMVFACCFYYSTSFSKNDFSSLTNSTKEVRLLRNDNTTCKFEIKITII